MLRVEKTRSNASRQLELAQQLSPNLCKHSLRYTYDLALIFPPLHNRKWGEYVRILWQKMRQTPLKMPLLGCKVKLASGRDTTRRKYCLARRQQEVLLGTYTFITGFLAQLITAPGHHIYEHVWLAVRLRHEKCCQLKELASTAASKRKMTRREAFF